MTYNVQRLRLCIRTQDTINQCKESTLSLCIDSLLNVFGSKQDRLKLLINSAKAAQLKIICNIIKQQTSKESKKQHQKTKDVNTEYISFDVISKQSVQHICNFLNSDDILHFKNTSRRISIVCLEEMNKYRISIIHGHKLLNAHSITYQWSDAQIITRHKQNTKYMQLLQSFNISLENQLIFRFTKIFHESPYLEHCPYFYEDDINDPPRFLVTMCYQCEYLWNQDAFNEHHLNNTIKSDESLVVFNKKDVTLFDLTSNKQLKLNDNDLCYKNKKGIFVILHYFDIHDQCLKIVDFLMFQKKDICDFNIHYIIHNKLTEYIQNELIANDMNQYKNLTNLINEIKMKQNAHDQLFQFYLIQKKIGEIYDALDAMSLNYCYDSQILCDQPISIVFQINPLLNPQKLQEFKTRHIYDFLHFQQQIGSTTCLDGTIFSKY